MSDSVSGTPYTNPLKIDASTDNFYKIMDRLEGKSNVYVAFFANWCPDCTSIPTVVETLQTNPEVTVVMCNVGEPMKWRSGDHVFKERAAFMEIEGKQRKPLALRGVPTLMKWGVNGKEDKRLEKGLADGSAWQIGGEIAVNELVSDFMET
eukprot:CAMPEP_0119043562 /NCGR_PEP_ID=MMETSP1177-20130426/23377_1 /TAXON_ID=2985 /ORGANISM="Ochromonas sp, Strain CCMP1899" /LENGTH=150 /DNA_ID=CAMNT_0007011909 /DNA_START=157 /DNA_END=609 /DNA_ORIENTATION=-